MPAILRHAIHYSTRGNHAELPDSSDLRDHSGKKLDAEIVRRAQVMSVWKGRTVALPPSFPLGDCKESSPWPRKSCREHTARLQQYLPSWSCPYLRLSVA